MRRELFEIARSFKQDKFWLQVIALFGNIEQVERLLYEAEQKVGE